MNNIKLQGIDIDDIEKEYSLKKECQRINHCFIHRREDEWKGAERIRF